jgi:4'-phosphopantetheinyl transferase
MKKVSLFFLNIDLIKDNEDDYLSFLTKEELEKALRFKVKDDYYRYLGSVYLKKKYTGTSELKISKYGKPYKDDIYFNVSHSGKYVIMGLSDDKEIGVDIEEIKEIDKKMYDYVLSDEERRECQSLKDFFEFWTLKEALAKCVGLGLGIHLKNLISLPKQGKKEYLGNTYYTKVLEHQGHIVSVCVKEDDFELEIECL